MAHISILTSWFKWEEQDSESLQKDIQKDFQPVALYLPSSLVLGIEQGRTPWFVPSVPSRRGKRERLGEGRNGNPVELLWFIASTK